MPHAGEEVLRLKPLARRVVDIVRCHQRDLQVRAELRQQVAEPAVVRQQVILHL